MNNKNQKPILSPIALIEMWYFDSIHFSSQK